MFAGCKRKSNAKTGLWMKTFGEEAEHTALSLVEIAMQMSSPIQEVYFIPTLCLVFAFDCHTWP
jgi:hypothetical protein